jgi:hypothetical protein
MSGCNKGSAQEWTLNKTLSLGSLLLLFLEGPGSWCPGCTAAIYVYCTNPALEVHTCTARRPHVSNNAETSSRENGNSGREMFGNFAEKWRLPHHCRDLLRATNLRHGTDGFTSPPKEGTLRIFSPWKIRRLRSGSNPRTWVPEASVKRAVRELY